MNKTYVIHHSADFDGLFCREIAKHFLKEAILIGWDYGDDIPTVESDAIVVMLDISIDALMTHKNLLWIDHHKTAIEKHPSSIAGYRIDGVAACRLAWQFFTSNDITNLPSKEAFVSRSVEEPLSIRLAGEYDIWDKRDPRVDKFQHGLSSQDLDYERLFVDDSYVNDLCKAGASVEYSRNLNAEKFMKTSAFTIKFEGYNFIAANFSFAANSAFISVIKPEHDACMAFRYDGENWNFSLRQCPGKDVDLSVIAKKYGGGGHRTACGFNVKNLPF